MPFSARGAAGGFLKRGDRRQIVERREKDEGTARTTRDDADRIRRVIDRDALQADFAHHRRDRVGPLPSWPDGDTIAANRTSIAAA